MRKLLILSGLLLNAACNQAVEFAKVDAITTNPDKPGESLCLVNPQNLTVPTQVIAGQSFMMSFNRSEVQWQLSQGATSIAVGGASVQITLSGIGTFNGEVRGLNNCNREEVRQFSIEVMPPIEGLRVVINNDDAYTRVSNVTLTLTAIAADEMYVSDTPGCLSGGNWEPYNMTKTWTLGLNNQVVRVYSKFRNGLQESACVSDDIVHDSIVPTVRFGSVPASVSSSNSANFQIIASDSGSGIKDYLCKLDSGNYQLCSASPMFSGLSDGPHTLTVMVEDAAGNRSVEISHSWEVDTTAPVVQITQAPSSPTVTTSARFEFTVIENGSGVQSVTCRLDSGSSAPCSSPVDYSGLTIGNHTFRVEVKDEAGLMAFATHSWEIQDDDSGIVDQPITIVGSGSGMADILFVVDNSQSMHYELNNISLRLRDFINELNGVDYHIAVTTGDTRNNNRDYSGGKLAHIEKVYNPRIYKLTNDVPNPLNKLQATVARPEATCTEVGTHLCPRNSLNPYQEGIHASLLAIDRPENAHFFRSEAPLNIVIISDTDEGSGSLGDNRPAYNRPETLVSAVNAKWPGRTFKVHSVIVKPGDYNCFLNAHAGRYGETYARLTQMTGGVMANICRHINRTEINQIAQSIKSTASNGGSTQQSYQLQCVPRDTDGDGNPDVTATYSPQPSVVPSVVVSGNMVTFTPALPAGTQVNLRYRCP